MQESYQQLLAKLRTNVSSLAGTEIPKLYWALRAENKTPEEARTIIEHDIGDKLAKRTIIHYMPSEAKDHEKQKGPEERKKLQERFGGSEKSDAASVAAPLPKRTVLVSTGSGGNGGSSDSGKVLVDAGEIAALRIRERELNSRLGEKTKELQETTKNLVEARQVNQGLQQTISKLRNGKEEKSDKPFKQVTLDSIFKNIVEVAHSEKCPAGCKTWHMAQKVSMDQIQG